MDVEKKKNDFADLSDAELMELVTKDRKDALVEVIHRYQQKLLNFFIRMGVYTDAEDLVQETFVRLYKHRLKYQAKAKFSTYLYTIARNIWRDFIRKISRYDGFKSKYKEETTHEAPARTGRVIAKLDVQAALDKLSDKLRIVLVMSMYQGLTYQEIADTLNLPLGTVKSRMKLAMNNVRTFLNER